MKDQIWKNIVAVREQSPLVLNITNFVVMNNTANALLAAGASPIMAHAVEEIEDMAGLCAATVINIGTLDDRFVEAMKLALACAAKLGKPTVIDPVGAGATAYRNQVMEQLFAVATPMFIRANADEISSVSGVAVESKGVDSVVAALDSVDVARSLALAKGCVVSMSGQTDVVTDGARTAYIDNGDSMMTKVTGLGCSASALLGAFAAIERDPFVAAVSAAAFLAICGQMAADESIGPGSLQVNLLDIMFTLTEFQFSSRLELRLE